MASRSAPWRAICTAMATVTGQVSGGYDSVGSRRAHPLSARIADGS